MFLTFRTLATLALLAASLLGSENAHALWGKSWIITGVFKELDAQLEKGIGLKVEACSFNHPHSGVLIESKTLGTCAEEAIWSWVENYFHSSAGKTFSTITLDLRVRFKYTPADAPARHVRLRWTPVGLSQGLEQSESYEIFDKLAEIGIAIKFYFDNSLELTPVDAIPFDEIGEIGQVIRLSGIPALDVITLRTLPITENKKGFLGIEYVSVIGSQIAAHIYDRKQDSSLPLVYLKLETDWYPGNAKPSRFKVSMKEGKSFREKLKKAAQP